jgi:hypothetical protein
MKHTEKKLIFLMAAMAIGFPLLAQNPLSQQTQVEVGIGFVSPVLQGGKELDRSQALRDDGLSYFENSIGERKNVGKYSGLLGYSFNIGFHKPIKRVKGLMMGAVVRNSQTGSTPKDGYSEAYYFNFITAGVSFKYYPFEENNFFTRADVGMAAVFTKNRFLNEEDEQNFFHQFGIGYGGSVALGYSLTPFKNKTRSLDLMMTYQQLGTRVEVNGVGDDQWKFGAVNFTVAMSF